MKRDASMDKGGDHAAWRDLVARLELPSVVDPANAPWPDRENLSQVRREETTSPPDATADESPEADPSRESPDADAASGSADTSVADGAPDAGAASGSPAGHSRVVRPATFLSSPMPVGADDCQALDYDDQEFPDDFDDRYIPPPVPPLPRLDPVAKGAWTALFGGPAFLFLATLLGWQLPGWVELGAIVAFVAGFAVLVSRLGDGPSRRDGPDQGAVV